MTAQPQLTLISPVEPPVYPIPTGERLSSHYYLQWHHHDWLGSTFRLSATKEVRAIGFDLFCIAHGQDPAGTLPVEELLLARLVGETLEEWRRLMSQPVTPLYGWKPCVTETGARRLYHPKVLRVVTEAWKGREAKLARMEADRERKRVEALPDRMIRAGASQRMVADAALVVRFDQFMIEQFDVPGKNRTIGMIRAALEAFTLQSEGLPCK